MGKAVVVRSSYGRAVEEIYHVLVPVAFDVRWAHTKEVHPIKKIKDEKTGHKSVLVNSVWDIATHETDSNDPEYPSCVFTQAGRLIPMALVRRSSRIDTTDVLILPASLFSLKTRVRRKPEKKA
jgi:hypothetical protein